jgi:hypothetical protein
VDHRAARPAIKKLIAEDGPLQLSLFDQQDLAEITSEDFPGERLIACRNPVLPADFRGLLEHLATLTRSQVRFTGTRAEVPMLAEPTSAQREAFTLVGAAIPLSLK